MILHNDQVLLGRRSDSGALTPVTGVVDPGEEPADAAAREALEEAGVVIEVERLAWVHQIPRVTYANGDQCDYLDLTFRCRWVSGAPIPLDGELTEVGWFALPGPAEIPAHMAARIEAALTQVGRFERSVR